MGIAERREREKEHLRTAIIEAARDILSEEGLDTLSMRAIAERIEYSPATIYLHFKDKDDLIRQVVHEGFHRLVDYARAEVVGLGPSANAAEQYVAQARAYVRFALENTAYFRVMFELPTVAQLDCEGMHEGGDGERNYDFDEVVQLIERARAEGTIRTPDALRTAVIGWGLMHGLTSLFLAGHLAEVARSGEEFMALIDEAMAQLYQGWGGGREPNRNPEGESS